MNLNYRDVTSTSGDSLKDETPSGGWGVREGENERERLREREKERDAHTQKPKSSEAQRCE